MTWIPVCTKCRLQNVEYRPDTKCKLQTAEWVQNADWEFKVFFRLVCDDMSSYNLPAERHATLFHDYLHYCIILLARFLIKTVLNIICTRIGWCYVCTDFTNLIKVDVDVNERYYWILNTRNIREKLTALHVVHIIIFLSGMCLFCWQKCGPRPKLFPRLNIYFQR